MTSLKLDQTGGLRVICSAHGLQERCAEPGPLRCYGAYGTGECDREVHYRPGHGPGMREIFCPDHGRQPWPPERQRVCSSQDLGSSLARGEP